MFYNGVRLGDILAWGFGLNDATGNHIDGGPVIAIVRRAGIAANASAVASISATNLSTVYPAGLYEVVFSVSADTYSLVDGANYLVYAYASASGLSTVACIGGFRMAPPAVDVTRVGTASASAAMSAIAYVAVTSAMRDVGVLSAQAASVVAKQALVDYDVPTSADVSAIVAAEVMTSASASALFYTAALSAIRAVGVLSAQAASVVAKQALTDYDVPTSADVSAIVAGALADYDAPTSADVSAIVNTSWKITTLAEPTDVPAWSSATPANLLAWLGMLATNRMVQTSAKTIIQNAANTEIASASVAYDGTTFTRGPWVG